MTRQNIMRALFVQPIFSLLKWRSKEQRISVKFLVKLGKHGAGIRQMLQKAYGTGFEWTELE